ncbi:hypothetical protein Avbf_11562 [Armadillidium vulgare]|nr:hypothetical protein Avbf_11562 [Armadillidium vulgare]
MEYEGTKKKLKEKKRDEKHAKKYSFIETNDISENDNSVTRRKTYSQIMENDSANRSNVSRCTDIHSQSYISTSSSSSFGRKNSLKDAPKIRRLNTLSPNHFKNKMIWSSIPESTQKESSTAYFLRRKLVSSSAKRIEKKLPNFEINNSFERNAVSNLLGFPVDREKERKSLEKTNEEIPHYENSVVSKIYSENFIFTNENLNPFCSVRKDAQLQFVRHIESSNISHAKHHTEAYENPFQSDKSLQLFSHAAFQIDYKSINIRESVEAEEQKVIKNISLNRSFSIHEINKRNESQTCERESLLNEATLTPSLKKTTKQNSFLLSPWLASLAYYQNTLTDKSSEQSLDHSNSLKPNFNTSDSTFNIKESPAKSSQETHLNKKDHCHSNHCSSEGYENSSNIVKDQEDTDSSRYDTFEREVNISPETIVNSPPESVKEINVVNKSNESFEKFRRTTPSLRRLKLASMQHGQEEEGNFLHISGSSDNDKEFTFFEDSEDLFDREELLGRQHCKGKY